MLATAAVLGAAAVGGACGLGPGESSSGEARLTVTRDYGAEPVLEATVTDPSESETVIRMLDRETEITTRFGGGFVHSIEGVAGELSGGRSLDWFFYVNGIESSTGAADVPVHAGDRIWWDYRDWTDAMRIAAVVGSWPEPFAQVSAGAERLPVRIVCSAREVPCDEAAERLADEGVEASVEPARQERAGTDEAIRVLVGTWSELERDPVASQLAGGPEASGVFASFEGNGGGRPDLVGYGVNGDEAVRFGPGAGLVAALRDGEDPPTWIVAGTDEAGVEAAVELLGAGPLADRYAVAVAGQTEHALPIEGNG